ncbi:MAG TPA: hypothetical protein VED17_01615 [Nitrososphaerales archaeon]|nr:hypothetical protein [Nitrososphaerales archaeon]
MKIRFGLIYLVFVVIGASYELVANHFSGIAIVNYLLDGFLYSSIIFIIFYIIVRIAFFAVDLVRHNK